MNTNQERIAQLYNGYLAKNLTAHQQLEFFNYVQNPDHANFIEELISESYEHPDKLNSLSNEAKDRVFNKIVRSDSRSASNAIKLWPRIAITAAIATIVFGTTLFYNKSAVNNPQSKAASYKNDVAPGTNGATLTLSNGKKIRLSDTQNGEMAEEAGVTISKSANGELVYEVKANAHSMAKLNTLSTAIGETYKLRLPDGSYVWLNSASSLTYSTRLIEKGIRTVKLQGEGYFEITKDKSHPFVVNTDKQQVKVLGTHFNINSYTEEASVATTLIEGSVSISSGKLQQLIRPGEQSVNDGKEIKVNSVNTENIVDWKNGDFNLDELDFRVAMRKIARWYNIDVVYDASVPQHIKSGGWISRNRSLSAVLRHIESSGQVKFEIEGRKVYVTK